MHFTGIKRSISVSASILIAVPSQEDNFLPKGQIEEDIERTLNNEFGKLVCCALDCQQRFLWYTTQRTKAKCLGSLTQRQKPIHTTSFDRTLVSRCPPIMSSSTFKSHQQAHSHQRPSTSTPTLTSSHANITLRYFLAILASASSTETKHAATFCASSQDNP